MDSHRERRWNIVCACCFRFAQERANAATTGDDAQQAAGPSQAQPPPSPEVLAGLTSKGKVGCTRATSSRNPLRAGR